MRILLALLALVIPFAAARGDALSELDEVVIAVEIMDKCHLVVPGIASQEKLRKTGEAAFQQLWDAYDEKDPAHHQENARKADFDFKKRTERVSDAAREKVAMQGCQKLSPHALEILGSYRQ